MVFLGKDSVFFKEKRQNRIIIEKQALNNDPGTGSFFSEFLNLKLRVVAPAFEQSHSPAFQTLHRQWFLYRSTNRQAGQ